MYPEREYYIMARGKGNHASSLNGHLLDSLMLSKTNVIWTILKATTTNGNAAYYRSAYNILFINEAKSQEVGPSGTTKCLRSVTFLSWGPWAAVLWLGWEKLPCLGRVCRSLGFLSASVGRKENHKGSTLLQLQCFYCNVVRSYQRILSNVLPQAEKCAC